MFVATPSLAFTDSTASIDEFQARSSDELTFVKGDHLELIERDDEFGDGWYLGRHLGNGNTGLFPECLFFISLPSPPWYLTYISLHATGSKDRRKAHAYTYKSSLRTTYDHYYCSPRTHPKREFHSRRRRPFILRSIFAAYPLHFHSPKCNIYLTTDLLGSPCRKQARICR